MGCGRGFQSEKALSAHESQCKKSSKLHVVVFSKHHHLEKNRHQSKKWKCDQRDSLTPDPSPAQAPAQLVQEVPMNLDDHRDFFEPNENITVLSQVQDPPPVISARSGRRIRLPARYIDFLPGELTGLRQAPLPPDPIPAISLPHPSGSHLGSESPLPTHHKTDPDHFGLYRVYPMCPTLIPNKEAGLFTAVDAPTLESHNQPTLTIGSLAPLVGITQDNLHSAFSSPTGYS
ncbi:hypothetical protein PAXRUDRAFT_162879 [Paxillus rubicundulus Ve08.2h10]|uniref:Uncharacterized protein n=1 Tax=Paxillus rubicundulus Ve08.2h10 TaxID=930991 RepID=A0A0D0C760_9AGAM|nr:hypothetical protein PAXRUDRAFT_162879 [Paxillus rubicundulus Ve08.2h10]